MSARNGFESRFWAVLEKGRLADLSQFHRPSFYDEVPLYSRLADISFLSDCPTRQKNELLLRFSLKFLQSVISYEEHRTPYFAAITVWDQSSDDPIVPNLFVWSESVAKLYEKLTLGSAKSAFGRSIRRLVSQPRLADNFEVLEDRMTMPESTRVFIGPSLHPYRSFVPLHTFIKPLSAMESSR